MKAARSILRNGLTVVSGRGGTGKTELVAAVLGMAESHMDKAQVLTVRRVEEHTVEMDNIHGQNNYKDTKS